jgi:glucokinase
VSCVIGIDLGGTKVAAASLRDRELSESIVHPTELSSTPALIEQLVAVIDEAWSARAGEQLDAVGIGVPSIVEFATGRVVYTVNLPLADVPLRHVLSERLGGVPVFVDNDATVAALAEAHDEQLRLVAHNLVMLTVGTGIGGGIVLGGRIFRGATGGAGEIGHTIIAADPAATSLPERHFPQPGSLEYHGAGRALDRIAPTIGLAHGGEVVEAARRGEPEAVTAVQQWARMVGIGIANAINTFDPDEVVIGGGAAAAGDLLLGPATEMARACVVPGLGERTRIRLARFHATAGVLGAALLAAHELEGLTRAASGVTG